MDDDDKKNKKKERSAGKDPAATGSGPSAEALSELPLSLRVVLAEAELTLAELSALAVGTVLPIERGGESAVALMIGDRVLARGDLVDVGEGRLGVQVREVAT